jgi:putative Mg2+ transporter-C (MgtC) family protein
MIAPSDGEAVLRLLAAVLCGGAIGLERDINKLPTGFRTLSLVSLGSCIAVLAAIKSGDAGGISRVAQGIVTGIGFLGAGVILQGPTLHKVKGLTTAAAIWVTATIGILCGLGEIATALIATVLAVVILLLDVAGRKLWGDDRETKAERQAPRPPPPAGDH